MPEENLNQQDNRTKSLVVLNSRIDKLRSHSGTIREKEETSIEKKTAEINVKKKEDEYSVHKVITCIKGMSLYVIFGCFAVATVMVLAFFGYILCQYALYLSADNARVVPVV